MMTDAKLLEAIDAIDDIASHETMREQAAQFPSDRHVSITTGPMSDSDMHLLYMVEQMRTFVAEGRREKVMRWLGFAQGVLWAT